MNPPFELDSRLANDCIELGDLPLSRLLLMNDAQYPWFILVPRRVGVSEIYQLSTADQQQLISESSSLAKIIAAHFPTEKMNIANLGNIVPQLHLHHIARHQSDPAWPGPVWGKFPAVAYQKDQIQQIRRMMGDLLR